MITQFVEVKGSGATEFLGRVTASTVRGVEPGQGRAGVLLNGQSRMIAQYDLLCLAPGHYFLAAPESCASALAEGIEALHFAEDLEIRLLEQRAGAVARDFTRGEVFTIDREGGAMSWPSAVAGFAFSTSSARAQAGWDFARIGALVPWPPFEWDATTPALEAGMLPWIDRLKGCYPGQEVVELSLNVGHPVRVLLAVSSPSALSAGAKISWDDKDAVVTSAASRGAEHRAIVRIPWAKRDFLPPGFGKLRAQF